MGMVTERNYWEEADELAYKAYQMYSGEPKDVEGAFPMYSYNTPAYTFWGCFVEELLRKGATHEECEEILKSKLMRWMWDNPPDEFFEVVKKMADQSLIDEVRTWER